MPCPFCLSQFFFVLIAAFFDVPLQPKSIQRNTEDGVLLRCDLGSDWPKRAPNRAQFDQCQTLVTAGLNSSSLCFFISEESRLGLQSLGSSFEDCSAGEFLGCRLLANSGQHYTQQNLFGRMGSSVQGRVSVWSIGTSSFQRSRGFQSQ